jgi:hypothetical protein
MTTLPLWMMSFSTPWLDVVRARGSQVVTDEKAEDAMRMLLTTWERPFEPPKEKATSK